MTRVLIFGGTNYADADQLHTVCSRVHEQLGFSCVIEGEARGADTLARDWAQMMGIPVDPFPADWDLFGERAGAIRNARMLRDGKPNYGIGFPGGPGTRDMTRRLYHAGVPAFLGTWSSGRGSKIIWRLSQKHLASR